MQPYFLTLAFLTLMSILTSSELVRFADSALETRLYENAVSSNQEIEELRAHSHLENFRKHKIEKDLDEDDEVVPKLKRKRESQGPRRARSLGFNLDRPPNNARLNFYHLAPMSPMYEIAVRFLHRMYGEASFFNTVPDAAERLLKALFEKKEECESFLFPDELAGLQFEDEEIQKLFHFLLKGHEGKPSLLQFISFDKTTAKWNQQINLTFADEQLVHAIFNHEAACKELIALRKDLLDQMLAQEARRLAKIEEENSKTRTDYKTVLTDGFDRIVKDAGLDPEVKKIFDFTLRSPGNILFVVEEESGIVLREKVK